MVTMAYKNIAYEAKLEIINYACLCRTARIDEYAEFNAIGGEGNE